MEDGSPVPTADQLLRRVDAAEDDATLANALDGLDDAPATDRAELLRSLRNHAQESPDRLAPLLPTLATQLTAEDRAVRLTTTKLFVAVAESSPATVLDACDALADRLADESEFYFVRARAAEALGHVALERPEAATDPEVLANLTIGLDFDEPEVRTALAGALERVALGDPDRLAHRTARLAEHLADEGQSGDELVRYHCTTALAAVACESPGDVAEVEDALATRLADDQPFVVGRAAETIGVLAAGVPDRNEASTDPDDLPDPAALANSIEDGGPVGADPLDFATDRIRFARGRLRRAPRPAGSEADPDVPESLGTITGIRATTDDAVAAMTAPEDACPNCGAARPPEGPPICPSCGTPF